MMFVLWLHLRVFDVCLLLDVCAQFPGTRRRLSLDHHDATVAATQAASGHQHTQSLMSSISSRFRFVFVFASVLDTISVYEL